MSPSFRNVDIELRTQKRPAAFLRALRLNGASLLWCGQPTNEFLNAFEIDGGSGSPAKILTGLKRLFASLTPRARAQWDEADRRIFDFGFDLKGADRTREFDLPVPWLAFAASVNAIIRITVYDENHSDLKSRDA